MIYLFYFILFYLLFLCVGGGCLFCNVGYGQQVQWIVTLFPPPPPSLEAYLGFGLGAGGGGGVARYPPYVTQFI